MRAFHLLAVAFSLLTIIPLSRVNVKEDELRESVVLFPIVGLIIGACGYVLIYFSNLFFGESVSALLYIIFSSMVTGGLHIDGLSDTFDALSAKSVGDELKDRERRLSIMEQGTTGPIGVLSLIILILLKLEILKEVISRQALSPLIVLIPSVSRSSLSIPMYFGKSAKDRGLGKIFVGKFGKRSLILTLILCETLILSTMAKSPLLLHCLLSSFISFLASYVLLKFFESRFGGITGDNLGAINEIVEVLFPSLFILFSNLKI